MVWILIIVLSLLFFCYLRYFYTAKLHTLFELTKFSCVIFTQIQIFNILLRLRQRVTHKKLLGPQTSTRMQYSHTLSYGVWGHYFIRLPARHPNKNSHIWLSSSYDCFLKSDEVKCFFRNHNTCCSRAILLSFLINIAKKLLRTPKQGYANMHNIVYQPVIKTTVFWVTKSGKIP